MTESETTVVEAQYTVRAITAPLVDYFWNFAEPYIKRALDHSCGEYKPEDIKRLAKDRSIQLWLISEGSRVIGAVTTQIIDYPQRRHCQIITLAGSNAAAWAETLDIIIYNWAKQLGCIGLEANVRKGLVPVLSDHGYRHKYSVVVKEIHKES